MSMPDPFGTHPGPLTDQELREDFGDKPYSDKAFICVAAAFVLIIGLVGLAGSL